MKDMKEICSSIKEAWFKGVKAIGESASNLAYNAKFHLDELTLENARRDSLGNISLTVYELWKRGTEFPPEVDKELVKLEKLDMELNELRRQKLQADLARKHTAQDEGEAAGDVFEEEAPVLDAAVSETEDTALPEQAEEPAGVEVPPSTEDTTENQ